MSVLVLFTTNSSSSEWLRAIAVGGHQTRGRPKVHNTTCEIRIRTEIQVSDRDSGEVEGELRIS